MVDIHALVAKNAQRWAGMHLKADRIKQFDSIAQTLCLLENKTRFQVVTHRLQAAGYSAVPWWFIAVMAYREYGGPPHWDKQLAQGDPLSSVSTHDPKGRGPFFVHQTDTGDDNAWVRGALDALIDCGPYAAKWKDWSIGGVLTLWEEENGLGYAMRGVPSSYVWSGTDQYVSGKYVADHVYRSGTVDVQQGCAAILSRMMNIDKSIVFGMPAPINLPHPDVSHPIVTGAVVNPTPNAIPTPIALPAPPVNSLWSFIKWVFSI